MRSLLIVLQYVCLPLLMVGCGENREDEEVDYDRMVKNEEEVEWISSPSQDGQHIAGELFPDPQEIILQELPDSSSQR